MFGKMEIGYGSFRTILEKQNIGIRKIIRKISMSDVIIHSNKASSILKQFFDQDENDKEYEYQEIYCVGYINYDDESEESVENEESSEYEGNSENDENDENEESQESNKKIEKEDLSKCEENQEKLEELIKEMLR